MPTVENRGSVHKFLEGYSIEVTAQQSRRIDRFDDLLALGTRVYIPHTPHTDLRDITALAVRIRTEQMVPVPHVVARRIGTLAVADDFLARLVGEADVAQVLVVAGDVARPAGGLRGAQEVLESGLLEKHRIRTIGVAGYPEGHPTLSDDVLRDALDRKRAYAEQTGATVYIVTQFAFSADPVIAWERSIATANDALSVIVGLPGLATARTLLKYAVDCGVGASVQAFAKRYGSLTKLLLESTPGESLAALARHREQTPDSRLAGVHFYTFGSFARTVRWANDVLAGKLEVVEEGAVVPVAGG